MDFLDTIKDKTDKELIKMVYDFNSWNPEMLSAVEQELNKRNILPTDLKEKKENLTIEENIELTKGKQAGLLGQVVGWLTVFGFLGIFMGYNYAYSKERSKYTDKIYFKYNESSRENGRYLFFTALVMSSFALFYKLFVKSF